MSVSFKFGPRIFGFFNLNFFTFDVFKRVSYFFENFIVFRFCILDFFNHNIFIFNVFNRLLCFLKFGPSMFFAFCDVSYFYRRFLSNVACYKTNSKKWKLIWGIFTLWRCFRDYQHRRPWWNARWRIGNKMRQVCRWSSRFNNCEIGQRIGAWLLNVWILWPMTIISPMAQLKDSFFSRCMTFTFWTKLPLFPINLKGFC